MGLCVAGQVWVMHDGVFFSSFSWDPTAQPSRGRREHCFSCCGAARGVGRGQTKPLPISTCPLFFSPLPLPSADVGQVALGKPGKSSLDVSG